MVRPKFLWNIFYFEIDVCIRQSSRSFNENNLFMNGRLDFGNDCICGKIKLLVFLKALYGFWNKHSHSLASVAARNFGS